MIVKLETVLEIDEKDRYRLDAVRNDLERCIAKNCNVKRFLGCRIQEHQELTKDLADFTKSKLAVYIDNAKEYVNFVTRLEESGYDICNSSVFSKDPNDYDPRYPYFFIQEADTRYMNANTSFYNIEKQFPGGIALKTYADLDFVKYLQEMEQIEERD